MKGDSEKKERHTHTHTTKKYTWKLFDACTRREGLNPIVKAVCYCGGCRRVVGGVVPVVS